MHHKTILRLLLITLVFLLAPNRQVWGQESGLQQMQMQLESAQTDSQKISIIVDMGGEAMDRGTTESARRYLNRARDLADSLDYMPGRRLALYGFGDFYLVQQKYDSAETVLKQAMELNPNPPLRYKVQNLLATSYRYQGQNQRAIDLYRHVLASIDTTRQVRMAAGVSQNMADAYMNMGLAAEAFKNYNKAIRYGEAANDSVFMATSLNNVGLAHHREEQFEEAAYYLERSLDISRAIGFRPGQLRATLNLGNTRSSQEKFKESEGLYREALRLSEEVRPNVPPVQIQYNLGELYYRMEQYGEAESNFRESLENSRQGEIPQGIYYNSTGLGNVAESRGNTTEAINRFNQALDMAQKLENPSFLQETHQHLYELYKEQGDFETALGHLESFKTIADSLKTRERERMLAEYETKLKVQRQQQQNEALQSQSQRQQSQLQFQSWLIAGGVVVLLIIAVFAGLLYRANREKKKINQQLEQQKAELEEVNKVKNKLFGIVAHDLRSPLSSLISMLDLFRDHTLSEQDVREMTAELELALQQNVNVMENLLVWADQQMSGISMDVKSLNARRVAQEMLEAHAFSAEYKNIAIENRLEPGTRVLADYEMLKLVMRNLISNAIKFSEDGDRIVLDTKSQNGEVIFEISDTGIGIPEEQQDQIFSAYTQSRKGTRNERGSGMGLSLCKEFIKRQGGDIYFESEVGEGTSFYFTLPAVNE